MGQKNDFALEVVSVRLVRDAPSCHKLKSKLLGMLSIWWERNCVIWTGRSYVLST